MTMTPAAGLEMRAVPARRALQAGDYAAAETLFHQLALTDPGVEPAAELCTALQLWERGEFARAAASLRRFVNYQPPARLSWLKEEKLLAQDRLGDYQLSSQWEKTRGAIKDPAVALEKLHELNHKLKTKGSLAFRLAGEEAKVAAHVSELAEKRAVEEQKRETEETPRWNKAMVAERSAIAAYQFENARVILDKVKLTAASLQAERDKELQRALWLVEWKTKLISDINETGFAGPVTDVHGVRYDGPVRRATSNKLELKTRYGNIMTDWLNLSPTMLLTISTAFIRPAVSDLAERQWLSAIFASQTGQTHAANELATKAAEAKPEFRDLLPRFFPSGKK